MKCKSVYICEYCGKESESKDEIKLCEATHLGLTVEENGYYYNMKCNVDIMRHIVEKDSSVENQSLLEMVTNELREFETAHNIPEGLRYEKVAN